jgi:catechol 2,3-dioxygenase-like lactoylglutathione lyase family enzyme
MQSTLGPITPVIPARDVAAAIEFYVARLGFTESWRRGDPVDAAGIRRDDIDIHLFRCDDPKIAEWTGFRVRCTSLSSLYDTCRAEGIVHPNGPLRETPWQTREFTALDLDRVALTFWEPLAPE